LIQVHIPGPGTLALEHLVVDLNGTLSLDGVVIDGVSARLALLRERLHTVLLTANTHGSADRIARQLSIDAHRLEPGHEEEQKLAYVRDLGPGGVVAVGNGANDAAMLREAAVGICIVGPEGAAVRALMASDLAVPDIVAGLDLLIRPTRLIASLRR
jgi:P-type E1-E2 ATPase